MTSRRADPNPVNPQLMMKLGMQVALHGGGTNARNLRRFLWNTCVLGQNAYGETIFINHMEEIAPNG